MTLNSIDYGNGSDVSRIADMPDDSDINQTQKRTVILDIIDGTANCNIRLFNIKFYISQPAPQYRQHR